MKAKPAFVGAIDASPKRPQVFHIGYVAMEPDRRSCSGITDYKPWHVTINSVTEKQFRTHAKAIAYAQKHATKENQ